MSGELPGLDGRPCMVGFAQIPAALYREVASHRAIVLWGVLDIHQGQREQSWPSREHLADDLGCSVDSIERAAGELEGAGWVEIERQRGRGKSNRYKVLGRAGKRGNAALFSAVDNPEEKGRKSAVFSAVDDEEKAANLRVEKAANLRPLTRGKEPQGNHSGLSTTDRARESVDKCEHGRPIAVDGTGCALCAEQRQLWPTAINE